MCASFVYIPWIGVYRHSNFFPASQQTRTSFEPRIRFAPNLVFISEYILKDLKYSERSEIF